MPKLSAHSALAAMLLFAFIGVVLAAAFLPGAAAATVRSVAIWNDTAHPQVPFKGFDTNPPKVFDINGDGRMEIIVQNDNQWVYVFDSRTGAILFESTTRFPAGWGARSFNGAEVAIMSHGGATRLIVANSAAVITSFRYDEAAGSSGRMGFIKEWDRRADDCFSNPGMDAKPTLADLDKDGRMEILAATEESGLIALRGDGSLYWKNCLSGGNAEPAIADLNLDGWPDIVHVSDGGIVAALHGRTGGWMWGYDAKSTLNLGSGSIPVGAGIGQLGGLAGPDIVVGARDSHDTTNFENNHAALVAISSKGVKLWHFQDLAQGNPLTYCHPVIVDADRNGVNEVYWGDWNTMGHKPGAWEPTGPANFYRLDNAGKQVWRQTLNTYWSNKDIVLGDVDGDGVQEVLANGPGSNGDGIWYLDSRTGAKETYVSTHPWKVARGPILADMWGTGTMQWLVTVGPADASVHGGGVLVYDTGARYSSVYPHLPDPTLGSTTSPTPPPPTSSSKEAESFVTRTVGGAASLSTASGGAIWNLWSNGHIQDSIQGDGTSTLNVIASGSPVGGVWPTMVVSVDGVVARTTTVSSGALTTYPIAVLSSGPHTIRIAFTNDAASATEDRNLIVDVVRTGTGPTPPPPSTTNTKEAESFVTRTAGGPASLSTASAGAIWNLWSNGYIEDSIQGDGTTTLDVIASGSPVGGVWPTMVVSVDGVVARTTTVASSALTEYPIAVLSSGPHTIRIAFTNDASSSTEDRNLIVDVARTGTGPTPPPTTKTKEAESFVTRTAGGPASLSTASGGAIWNLWSNGHIQDSIQGDGTSTLNVIASGSPVGGVWPTMVVSIDGIVVRTTTVASSDLIEYPIAVPSSGPHTIRIAFTNDASSSTEDRNLIVDVARVGTGSTPPPTGTFPATFNVPSSVNNWWVEVSVSSSHTVTTVSAQVNGGAGVVLSPTDWGTWAKSFRVESGSKVVFVATDAAGATATSAAFTWP